MSVENKRVLSSIVYYTLAVLTLVFSGFFVYSLFVIDNVAMWAKIVYCIWIALVIATIIFDIMCTTNGTSKTITGLAVYVLSILSLIVAAILYFTNAGLGGLVDNIFNLFISISLLSVTVVGFMIATWIVGESMVEHKTAVKEIAEKERISKQ